jgi:pimeloyl-ACP methyl ester carboxylesterase
VLIWDLKQVRRYFREPGLREAIRDRVRAEVGPDTLVVVAHSLGSVVAYEALSSMPDHRVRALVTLGSPLGIPNLIFDRLDPAPVERIGRWPGSGDLVWTNIADRGDIVALVKDLRSVFGPEVRNTLVHNGVHAHSAVPYLTDALTGGAIAEGLAAGD